METVNTFPTPPATVAWSSYENVCNYAAAERKLRQQREDQIRRLNARIHLQRQEIRMLHKRLSDSADGPQPAIPPFPETVSEKP